MQLLEEPLVFTGLVLLLQSLLDGLFSLLSLRGLIEALGGDGGLEGLNVQRVSCGHQVVVVDQLDKGLDLCSLCDLLGRHALGHLQGFALNTNNHGVGEGVLLGTIIMGLDNDDLLTCETTADDNSDFTGLDELGHYMCIEVLRLKIPKPSFSDRKILDGFNDEVTRMELGLENLDHVA